MTSSFLQGRDNQLVNFAPTKSRFFKIILQDITRDNKLSLPRKFIREYGDGLSSTAILKVPNGQEWNVEIVTCDGVVCFQNGWQEFAKFYSLGIGYFLVFEYEGNSIFSVVIIDKSACEVAYQVIVCTHDVRVNQAGNFSEIKRQGTEDDGNCNVDALHDFSQDISSKRCGKSPLMCNSPEKTKFKCSSRIIEYLENPSNSSKVETVYGNGKERPCSEQEIRGSGGISAQEKHGQMAILMKSDELLRIKLAKTRRRARISFRAENPYFILPMSQSYLPPKTYLVLPTKFSNKYFYKHRGDAELIAMDGRSWRVRFSYQSPYMRSRVKLFKGWKKFTIDNDLNVGDVCAFELIKGIDITFKVHIFRIADDGGAL